MSKFKDITGETFGMITVLSFAVTGKRVAHWNCVCACGTQKVISGYSLRSGQTTSCGCGLIIRNKLRSKHNESVKIKEYMVWRSIKARCYNPNLKGYKNYGGRGITMCDRWVSSYSNFLNDMGRAPSGQHSIDRIDNNGNYDPGNCRWATRKEQQNNIRTNHFITYQGKTQTISQWCDDLNLNRKRTYIRAAKKHYTPEQIFNHRIYHKSNLDKPKKTMNTSTLSNSKMESHQEFMARLEAIRAKDRIQYRGWIIEPTQSYCPYGGYDYYPADEGRNDDADCSGDPAEYHYCGNVRFASTIEEAKDAIWEKVMTSMPQHKVVLNKRDYYFDWIDEAIAFAVLWNAEEFIPACNP